MVYALLSYVQPAFVSCIKMGFMWSPVSFGVNRESEYLTDSGSKRSGEKREINITAVMTEKDEWKAQTVMKASEDWGENDNPHVPAIAIRYWWSIGNVSKWALGFSPPANFLLVSITPSFYCFHSLSWNHIMRGSNPSKHQIGLKPLWASGCSAHYRLLVLPAYKLLSKTLLYSKQRNYRTTDLMWLICIFQSPEI